MTRNAATWPLVLLPLLLAACGPVESVGDSGAPDAGFDAGQSDAGGHDAGTDAGHSDAGSTDGGQVLSDGGLAPTLTNIQNTIFNAMWPVGCFAAATCHNTAHQAIPAGSLDLSTAANSYAGLVGANGTGVPAVFQGANMLRVDPGHPENSFLMVKIKTMWESGSTQYGNQMPYTGMQLSTDQINLIEQWIANGALND